MRIPYGKNAAVNCYSFSATSLEVWWLWGKTIVKIITDNCLGNKSARCFHAYKLHIVFLNSFFFKFNLPQVILIMLHLGHEFWICFIIYVRIQFAHPKWSCPNRSTYKNCPENGTQGRQWEKKKKKNSIIFCPQAATVKTDAGMQCSRISIKKGYMFQWHNLLSRMSLPEAKVILTAEGSPHSICKLPPVS